MRLGLAPLGGGLRPGCAICGGEGQLLMQGLWEVHVAPLRGLGGTATLAGAGAQVAPLLAPFALCGGGPGGIGHRDGNNSPAGGVGRVPGPRTPLGTMGIQAQRDMQRVTLALLDAQERQWPLPIVQRVGVRPRATKAGLSLLLGGFPARLARAAGWLPASSSCPVAHKQASCRGLTRPARRSVVR